MPISLDFPEITDVFRQFLLMPVRQIAHSFEALSLWLDRRVKLADALEQSSRAYPVIRFEADAVMMSLDRLQAGALASEGKPDGLAVHVGRAGERFVQGIGGISTAIRQERILPDALTAIAGAFDVIVRSVDLFAGPPSGMPQLLFGHSGIQTDDPLRRRASDLWGEAALAWRIVAGSTGQLKGVVGNIGEAMKHFATPTVPTQTPQAPLTDSMDAYGRYILAALILLPQIPAFAKSVWDSLVIVVKTRMIDAFARIEASINRVRSEVIGFFFVDLPAILRSVLSYSMAAQTVLLANLRFFSRFALGYGALLIAELKTWFDAVSAYVNSYIDAVDSVLKAVNRILQFNLTTIIGAVVGLPEWAMALLPTLTVDDLITANTEVARAGTRVVLTTFTGAIDWAVRRNPLIPRSIRRRLDAIPSLIWNSLRKPSELPDETATIRWPPGYGFPKLYDTVFGSGLTDFRTAIDGVARATSRGARDILGVGSVALNIIGDEFAKQADSAARMGSVDRFRQLAATADNQAGAVFGGDAERLRQGIAAQPANALANAFESWFAFGGFHALGEVIPAYARQLRELWQEKAEHGDEATVRLDMTSPRILAEHASLAGVGVKQVVIDALGKPVDRDLVAEIALQFKGVVQQAYLDGQKRLRMYANAVAV